MSSLRIKGGGPVNGEITVGGNKNAALPMIAAALLTDEPVVLENAPDIIDVRNMAAIAAGLGAEVRRENGSLIIHARNIARADISRQLCSKVRASLLFAAPLLLRAGAASLWPPGGDVIGRRRLDGHFYGLRGLGAELVSGTGTPFEFQVSGGLVGRDLFLDEASVTATEQLMMAAVTAKGHTTIRNAASEPHVTDLAGLLNAMGAEISGLGSNTIEIEGVEKLHGATHRIVGDHIEAGSFLALAAATGGEIVVRGTTPRHFWMTRRVFERLGAEFEINSDHLIYKRRGNMAIKPDFGNAIPVVSDGPWPQYPSDMMSCAIVMATQANGTVLFFEKMFESRIYFVDRLIGMGANAIVCDPHRVVITGPAALRPAELSSPDIRAGMAMLIAAARAEGESVINHAEMIERGYEDIVDKLRAVGVDIIEE